MNIQTPATRQIARLLSLGALTLALVVSAADLSGASSEAPFQKNDPQRGKTPPPHSDGQRSGNSQPRTPFWKDPAIIKEISLRPDQASKIEALWRKREIDMKGPEAELERQTAELKRLVAERKVGVDVIGVQSDRVEAQRTTLNKSRTIMLYQFSLVLSTEQNTALQAIFERNRRDRR